MVLTEQSATRYADRVTGEEWVSSDRSIPSFVICPANMTFTLAGCRHGIRVTSSGLGDSYSTEIGGRCNQAE